MHITFRSLRPEDLSEAAELIDAAFHAAYANLLSPDALARMSAHYLLSQWTPTAGASFIGLFSDDRLAGVARIGTDPESPGIGHLYSLYVHPRHQGQGLGQMLLRAAVEELRQSGFHKASLWVFAANVRANELYRRAGWLPTGRTRVEPEWEIEQLELHTALGNP